MWLLNLLWSIVIAFVCSAARAQPAHPQTLHQNFAAADGSQIAATFDPTGKVILASGTTKNGAPLRVEIAYRPGGLAYTLIVPNADPLKIYVLQGKRTVAVQASAGELATLNLIYQTPYVQVPDFMEFLQVYTAMPDHVEKSEELPGEAQVYPFVGNVLKGSFPAYEAAAQYFTPVFKSASNQRLPASHGFTIATKLVQYQTAAFKNKVCDTTDAGGSAFGLLVCFSVGIATGTQSPYPDALLAKAGLAGFIADGTHPTGVLQPCAMSGPDAMSAKPNCDSPDY